MTAQNEITNVLHSIIAVGKVHGLVLYKYRKKRLEAWMYTTTYALHSGRGRPDLPENCTGPQIEIVGPLGTTKKSKAYSKLVGLLNTLEE